jgi:fructose 1,6-bisphosphatase
MENVDTIWRFASAAGAHAPVDLEPARKQAAEIEDYMRRHGPFEPRGLPTDQMEYATMPELMEKHKG